MNKPLLKLIRWWKRKRPHSLSKLEKLLLQEARTTKYLNFNYTIKFYIYSFLLLNWSCMNSRRRPMREHGKFIENLIPEKLKQDIRKHFAYNKIFKRYDLMPKNFKQVNPYE